MGTLVAMIKEMNQWVVIADQIEVEMLDSVDLSDTMRYDPNNQVAHQWFRIENLSQTDYLIMSLMMLLMQENYRQSMWINWMT